MAKVLVVDNEIMITDLVKEILKRDGHSVSVASGGNECIKKLEKEKFDIVLLDIMMPDMSGWDVFQKIKKHAGMKIAFLSVTEITKERKEILMKEGLADFINKPFTPKDLSARVRALASK